MEAFILGCVPTSSFGQHIEVKEGGSHVHEKLNINVEGNSWFYIRCVLLYTQSLANKIDDNLSKVKITFL